MHRFAITSTRTKLLAASFPRNCISSFLSFYVSFNGHMAWRWQRWLLFFFFGYGSHDPKLQVFIYKIEFHAQAQHTTRGVYFFFLFRHLHF